MLTRDSTLLAIQGKRPNHLYIDYRILNIMEFSDRKSEFPLSQPREVHSVSSLNREARRLIEEHFGTVWVEGEISNLARPASGHLYWSIKDKNAQLRCAMFRQNNRTTKFSLENGQQVLARGRLGLYEARGEFQLVVDYLEESGEGLLRRKFEELKKKLASEGLFDQDRKQTPPPLPRQIGIITSPSGAAIRDILSILARRFPAVPVLLYPVAVQGTNSPEEICNALNLATQRKECDLLILARGGGSLEDLWSFNEEIVARAIAAVKIPIIVGIGHETDFTIADFVADIRAPTPSGAAELAVPDMAHWLNLISKIKERSSRAIAQQLNTTKNHIGNVVHRLHQNHPGTQLNQSSQKLDELVHRIRISLEYSLAESNSRLAQIRANLLGVSPEHLITNLLDRLKYDKNNLENRIKDILQLRQNRLKLCARMLQSVSPLATLERGYAIATDSNKKVIKDASTIPQGTNIDLRLSSGELSAIVTEVRVNKKRD